MKATDRRAVVAALCLGAVAGPSCSACDSLMGAESRIRATLGTMEKGFSVEVPAGPTLRIARISFREPQVFSDPHGYQVNALVDAEGQSGEAHVSYLGIEHIPFVSDRGAWRPKSPVLPNLVGILEVLRGRERAVVTRDVAAFRDRLLASTYRQGPFDREASLARIAVRFKQRVEWIKPVSWAIRVDRDQAEVSEDSLTFGPTTTGGSAQETRRWRFTLAPEGGLWRFTSGLE